MAGQIESLLEKGIEAAQAKEEARARDIFLHVIELDQRNERAWLWLSSVVETPTDKDVCLENVLVINPDNTYAAMGLRHLRQQPEAASYPPSILPRLASPKTAVEVPPPPAERVCSRCGFHNPGWAYLCDRCGASLRRVDLSQAVKESTKPRGRGSASLLEAWSGALVFSRRSAFVPEVELASWERSLAALTIAAILATGLRALTTVLVPILVNRSGYDLKNRLVTDALQWTGQTLLLIVLLVVIWVSVASLTWVGVRLAGGRQGFRIHAHIMAVAVSAWDLLGAIFAAMIVLVPYVLANVIPINLPFERLFNLTSIALGVAGFTWIAQGIRTAHHISATRAITVAVLTAAVGAVVILGLNLLTGGVFAARVSGLLVTYFMPWLG